MKRLAEAFFNLEFLVDRNLVTSAAEIDAYLAVAETLAGVTTLPPYVTEVRDRLLHKRAKFGAV
jgi:hypothetical protein